MGAETNLRLARDCQSWDSPLGCLPAITNEGKAMGMSGGLAAEQQKTAALMASGTVGQARIDQISDTARRSTTTRGSSST